MKIFERAQKPKAKDYRRAWEIVDNEGYLNILKEFRKLIR